METISLQARFTNTSWQWDEIRHRRMPRMKTRIKAGDLRDVRQPLEDGINGCKVIWLVQRSKWDKFVQIRKYLSRHHHRLAVSYPAVNNAVANTQHPCAVPF